MYLKTKKQQQINKSHRYKLSHKHLKIQNLQIIHLSISLAA